MKRFLLAYGKPWYPVYAGEGDGSQGGGEGGTGSQGGGEGGTGTAAQGGNGTGAQGGNVTGAQGGNGNGSGSNDDDAPKFSQKQLAKLMSEERKKQEERVTKTVAQLEELRKSKTLSDEEKKRLTGQIEELQNSLLSKEEQTKRELEKRDKEYRKSLDGVTEERTFWQGQYAEEATRNQILAASIEHEAVSNEQMMDLLMPKTRLVEIMDADGKGTRRFEPRIKIRTRNEKNEEVEIDLTVKDYVKRLKEEPERNGNLFKSGLSGGLGGNGSSGAGSGTSDKPPTDPAAYRQWRKTHPVTTRKS